MAPRLICDISTLDHMIFFFFIYMFVIIIIPVTTNGFSIKLIPRDSIDFALFPHNLTLEERHYRLSELSKAYALNLRSIALANAVNSNEWSTKHSPDTIQPPIVRITGNYYLAKISIGSQLYSAYLSVDTGADDTWVQCEGCNSCFPLQGGNFKYNVSSTYHILPCEHPLCYPKICGPNGICLYSNHYFINSRSEGWVSTDTFKFSGINQSNQSIPNVVFGSALNNQNILFAMRYGMTNMIAGVFGLGAGPRSILMQLQGLTKWRFSYCLPPWNSPYGTYTWLHFGDDAEIRGDISRARKIRMTPSTTRYQVNLTGIRVEERLLPINTSVFRLRPDYTGGFFLNSGCPHTFLVQSAYTILREEMVQYFLRRYNWHPLQGPPGLYDLCYRLPRGNFIFPSMTYQFEEADLRLDYTAIFEEFNEKFCMVILPIQEPGPNLLGSLQQANHRFLFNVRESTITFVQENCQNN